MTSPLQTRARSRLSPFALPAPVILYFLAILVPIHFYAGPLYITSVRLLLLVLIIPLTINLLRGEYGRLLMTDGLFFLFLVWMVVALQVNNPQMVVSQLGSMGVEFLCGYLLGRAYIRDEQSFSNLVCCILLATAVTLPFAIFETLTGRPLIIELIRKLPVVFSEPIVTIEKRWGLERAQVILAHPIHYGLFCSSAFSLTLVGLRNVLSAGKRMLLAFVVCLCVVFSLSSGALLSVILQLLLLGWAITFNRFEKRWLILLAFLVIAYVIVDLLSNRTPIRVFMSYATFSAHNAYWRGIIFEWGMKNVWANPIFGLGFNDLVRPWFMFSGSMDNFWLVMAVRYGIPGFLILAIGYVTILFRVGLRKFEKNTTLWQLRRAWMLTFIGFTFTLTTVHIWTTIYSFVFFLFGAGIWFLYADPEAASEPSDETAPASRRSAYHRATQDAVSNKAEGPKYTRFQHKD